MVVYAVWDREAGVRFPAPRLSSKGYEMRKEYEEGVRVLKHFGLNLNQLGLLQKILNESPKVNIEIL